MFRELIKREIFERGISARKFAEENAIEYTAFTKWLKGCNTLSNNKVEKLLCNCKLIDVAADTVIVTGYYFDSLASVIADVEEQLNLVLPVYDKIELIETFGGGKYKFKIIGLLSS